MFDLQVSTAVVEPYNSVLYTHTVNVGFSNCIDYRTVLVVEKQNQ